MPPRNEDKTYRIRQLPSFLASPRYVASFLANIVPDLAVEDVKVLSLAGSLNPLENPPTKVATVMFDRVPPAFDDDEDHWVIAAEVSGLARDVLVDVHFQDFTPLNDVPPDEHLFDCIAISGLASHPFGSWKQRKPLSNFMWLRDRLPKELLNARSIIYGYDTALIESESVKGVEDIALGLITKLKSIGRTSRAAKPLIMIAHSLGGIVLKQAMVMMARAEESNNVIMDSIRGVVMFGVPNKGMKISHLLPMVVDRPNAHLVQLLSTDSDYLFSLDQQFSGISTHRNIRIFSAYETKRSPTTRQSAAGVWRRDGPPDLLVDKSSAIQRSSSEHMPIDEDHSNLVKFGPDDQDCQAILVFMQDAAAADDSKASKRGESFSVHNHVIGGPEEDAVDAMMNSLNIEETGHRLDEVQAPYQSTFEWIFENKDLEFTTWLASPQEVYWISGKPGSGKSTIMKLARDDHRTDYFFKQHDPGVTHLIIDFFFHDRGSAYQKSLEGLLCRILHQLLEGVTALKKSILPFFLRRPENQRLKWPLNHLQKALHVILSQEKTPLRILLFLDALDEFDGESQAIVDFVRDIIRPRPKSATRIKICCSSRPWNIFRDVFSDMPGCRVHEHTRGDIEKYVNGRLEDNARLRHMIQQDERGSIGTAHTLRREITSRAEGVFIWVRLVLDELLKACTDGNLLEHLIQILSVFPDDLDKSYQRLIDRIPKDYRFESYIIIEVILRSNHPLVLRDIGLVLMCALDSTPQDSAKRLPSDPYSEEFLDATRRRLQSRCGGLLEVTDDSTVQFMHQTAKEFFTRPGSTEAVIRHDPILSKENGYSFLTKFWLTLISAKSSTFDWPSYIFSMYKDSGYYITEPHYLAGHPVLAIALRNSLERASCHVGQAADLFSCVAHAGFSIRYSVEQCLANARLSEMTTGHSQRDYLDRLPDMAIDRILYASEVPWVGRWTHFTPPDVSILDLARKAGLLIYEKELRASRLRQYRLR